MTIDRLFINVGTEITKVVPGLVSTEVDSKYVHAPLLSSVPARPTSHD